MCTGLFMHVAVIYKKLQESSDWIMIYTDKITLSFREVVTDSWKRMLSNKNKRNLPGFILKFNLRIFENKEVT